jgi:4-carboxymuconolactone decarboxylase
MTVQPQNLTQNLGGRLPLQQPGSLNKDAKKLFDRMDATLVQWADSIDFQSKTGDGRLIGPFNPVLFSPEIASRFLELQEAEQKCTTLSERVRQVVILTVGAVWKAAYELYAHSAAARRAGIPEDAIRILVAGGLPDALSPEEKTAQRYVLQLSADRRVDAAIYDEAERRFGARGLVDITFLAGIYYLLCALLNGFDIPSPEPHATPRAASDPIPSATPLAKLTLAASFPTGYFLENLAIRADHSVLVTVANKQELWYVPPTTSALPVEPSLLFKFDQNAGAVVETEPDVFHICTGNVYTTHEAVVSQFEFSLARLRNSASFASSHNPSSRNTREGHENICDGGARPS